MRSWQTYAPLVILSVVGVLVDAGSARAASPPAEPARVTRIKTWSNPTYTRVVIYVSRPVDYSEGEVAANESTGLPPRLYFDLHGARLDATLHDPIPIGDSLLKRVRTGQFKKDVVRVVLDIESIEGYRVFSLRDPFRLVIDVNGVPEKTVRRQEDAGRKEDVLGGLVAKLIAEEKPGGDKPAEGKPVEDKSATATKAAPPPKPATPPAPAQAAPPRPKPRLLRITIDAGHGGDDPGATGPGGMREKDVVLQIAWRLKARLQKELGAEVVMTRKKDEHLDLEERTAIANREQADLFISIHCNAHASRSQRGFETYYLNDTDDRYAMLIAARENASSVEAMDPLKFILADLALKSNVDESVSLANFVQNALVNGLKKRHPDTRDLGVKHALFYVLFGANMPSILVEIGFISNPTEEKRLRSNAFQEQVAAALCKGIKRFIKQRRLAYRKM